MTPLLRFRNIHEVISTIYIFLGTSVSCFLVFMAISFPTPFIGTLVIVHFTYIAISWLTFKRKTLENAIND